MVALIVKRVADVADGERFFVAASDAKRGRCRLGRGNHLTVEIDGVQLAEQLALAEGETLAFLTDDCPYDEGLHVYLLDCDGNVLDAIEAGSTYSTGVFRIIQSGLNWVVFEFFLNERRYRIEVGNTASFRLLLPAGWRFQRPWARHRLLVRAMPKGDS